MKQKVYESEPYLCSIKKKRSFWLSHESCISACQSPSLTCILYAMIGQIYDSIIFIYWAFVSHIPKTHFVNYFLITSNNVLYRSKYLCHYGIVMWHRQHCLSFFWPLWLINLRFYKMSNILILKTTEMWCI